MKEIHGTNLMLLSLVIFALSLTAPRISVGETEMTAEAAATSEQAEAKVSESGDVDDVQKKDEAVEAAIESETATQAQEQRDEIIQEAVDAIAQSETALEALDEGNVKQALDALAVTIGKLELIVAREPDLALAPVDVETITRDVFARPEAIQDAIEQAEKALEKGNVQVARHLLRELGSEIVFRVVNMPLATYPEAIKEVGRLIDQEKIDEARESLQLALNTMVVTEHVLPLPILRAEERLELAEELAKETDRDENENQKISEHLSAAKEQLKMADILGYGEKADYEELYSQIDRIEKNTAAGRQGEDFFNKLKLSISELWNSLSG